MSIYLHIGVGKTGTTSLQYFLKNIEGEIKNQNFHILKTGSIQGSAAHHDLATSFGFGHVNKVDSSVFKKELNDELKRAENKKIIISSENFHSKITDRKINDLASCLLSHDVKIIMYMRRQDQWIDSAFRQFVRAGNQRPIEKIVEHIISNRAVDYKWQIDMWGDVFGFENLILRVYEEDKMYGDTIADFSSVIGLTLNPDIKKMHLNVNPSLSPVETEICRLINVISRNSKKKVESRNAILDILRKDESIDHSLYHFMSGFQRKSIMSSFEESNSDVALRFFKGSNGRLFKDVDENLALKKLINFN